ncbi:hypothetical protein HK44_020515 [Pseudomonas fluorescens HK44]|uniref:Uncharacterized protein n=1 Tax=Pseudomonas fluorescens HK44 TaxID=1042209 RepID=A0A010SU54_PSEFL|nr:hypothetical protein [Pseudomonas fluorescens]EXF96280.1 hypothetical protein HK44_020515 [Pseudomonas fluorescens HK44]
MKISNPFKKAVREFLKTLGFIALCVTVTACIGVVVIASLNYVNSLGFSVVESVLIAVGAYSLLLALWAAFLAYRRAK